ncbi:MAG: GNAT family N-acetyltransferase, partial [Burkholderiales bacterium]|nr:GNAT family N-acetyltransferase [Burkholderiales bacterium]
MIERCTTPNQPGWLAFREALWPQCPRAEHEAEMASTIAAATDLIAFLAYGSAGNPIGLVEAALRTDYVNGTNSSPVAFLEGIYVVPESRGRGVARSLVAAVEQWALSAGCREFASDAPQGNTESHAMHRALGFE